VSVRITRRESLAALAGAASLRGQKLIGEPPGRIPPLSGLVNVSEFEAIARQKLDPLTFAQTAGSERATFDRITLRPRLMVDTTKMDLTARLLGQSLFTPILAGPISRQNRFHPEGELAMARGASAAKALMVVADNASSPVDKIAAELKGHFWYQVYLDGDIADLRGRVQKAIGAGARALCITSGTADASRPPAATAGTDWAAIDKLRKGLDIPVVLKGVMSPAEAQKAIKMGVQGLVVSNYSPRPLTGIASPIEVLPAVVDAVAGQVPVLMDGSVRLGSDVFKALAFGATAVLLGRPTVWGLAAYGAPGVQSVIELVQSELARDMAMCGRPNIGALDRTSVVLHRR